ncbi:MULTISPECIES: hypothetical protein [Kosakonia]|uniref:Uncharacterized protein n=1 Tax=Kosakonia sacchari TaxID=1158459 RepID=A0ABZ0MS07_9ENTR|nr:hypothetical protein [Kosakonia sacchari]WOZ78279.1 hypothetical protein Q8Y70_04205 [Kosakonia sacchari]
MRATTCLVSVVKARNIHHKNTSICFAKLRAKPMKVNKINTHFGRFFTHIPVSENRFCACLPCLLSPEVMIATLYTISSGFFMWLIVLSRGNVAKTRDLFIITLMTIKNYRARLFKGINLP